MNQALKSVPAQGTHEISGTIHSRCSARWFLKESRGRLVDIEQLVDANDPLAPLPINALLLPRMLFGTLGAHLVDLSMHCAFKGEIVADRALNYEKFFEEGETAAAPSEEYSSHNVRRLDVEGIKALLMKLDFMQRVVSGEPVSLEH